MDTTWPTNICIYEQHLIIPNSLQNDRVEAFLVDVGRHICYAMFTRARTVHLDGSFLCRQSKLFLAFCTNHNHSRIEEEKNPPLNPFYIAKTMILVINLPSPKNHRQVNITPTHTLANNLYLRSMTMSQTLLRLILRLDLAEKLFISCLVNTFLFGPLKIQKSLNVR